MTKYLQTMLISCFVLLPSYVLATEYQMGTDSLHVAQNDISSAHNKDIVLVKGTISNYDSIKKLIDKNSYLQIIAVPKDGEFTYKAEGGSLVFKSDSIRMSFPGESSFMIRMEGYNSNMKYYIAAQRLNYPKNQAVILSTNNGKWAEIDFSKIIEEKKKKGTDLFIDSEK